MALRYSLSDLCTVLSDSIAATTGESASDFFIWDEDLDRFGSLVCGGGWEVALQRIRDEDAVGRIPPAVILIGVSQLDWVSKSTSSRARIARRVLSWRGLVYIRYGFTLAEFVGAAKRAFAGRRSPLPNLQPGVDEFYRLAYAVRHWLLNKRNNVETMSADFTAASRSMFQLSSVHFVAVKATTPKHDRMLNSFIDGQHIDFLGTDGKILLAQFAASIAQFRRDWLEVESRRVVARRQAAEGDACGLRTSVDLIEQSLQCALITLSATIGKLDDCLSYLSRSNGVSVRRSLLRT